MRERAVVATFYVFRCQFEIAAALVSPVVKRTITEQTVKMFLVNAFMARKINTIYITKKIAAIFHVWVLLQRNRYFYDFAFSKHVQYDSVIGNAFVDDRGEVVRFSS